MAEDDDSTTEKNAASEPPAPRKENPVASKSTPGSESKEGNPRPHWADRIIAIFTGLIFLTYIASNYFACNQMNLTKKAIDQSAINNAAAILAQQKIAQDGLKASQDNFVKAQAAASEQLRLDERAWVTEVSISGEPQIDQPFAILVELRNTGKTPARHFQGKIVSDPSPRGAEPDLAKLKAIRYTGSGILAPNSSKFLTTYPLKGSATEKLPKEGMDEVKASTLYVFGRVEYDDIFDCHHWSTFCAFLDPRENYRKYSLCKQHNDADENRCPVSIPKGHPTP